MFAAVAGAGFAMRRILLHITPHNAGYGSPFLGLHYYTWAFVIFCAAIVLIGAMLLFDRQFKNVERAPLPPLAHIAVWLVIALTGLNFLNAFVECGFSRCADNPVQYELLGR